MPNILITNEHSMNIIIREINTAWSDKYMPLILGSIVNYAVQSGGALNTSEVQAISTHSKMNMQAAAGSFNIGSGNIILNPGGGNLLPSVIDPDVADAVTGC